MSGEEVGADAKTFLRFVSGDPGRKRLLLASMMSDGGLEVLAFLRWWDTEKYDAACIRDEISKLVSKLNYLFVRGHVVDFEFGCTRNMMTTLSSPRTFVVDNAPCCIGGSPRREEISSCLKEMTAWTTIAISVIRAEFPCEDPLQSFAIFNVGRCRDVQVDAMLARCAKTFRHLWI